MRKIELVLSNPVPGMEDEFNEWYPDRHVHEIMRIPVFSGYFYEAIGDKVVKP